MNNLNIDAAPDLKNCGVKKRKVVVEEQSAQEPKLKRKHQTKPYIVTIMPSCVSLNPSVHHTFLSQYHINLLIISIADLTQTHRGLIT